jgi:hypothetical protein
MLPVAVTKALFQQSRTTPFVPVQGFDADKRQVPMGLGRTVLFDLREGGAHIDSLLSRNCLCDNPLKRLMFEVNTRGKPKRDAKAIPCALCRSGSKRSCSERPE